MGKTFCGISMAFLAGYYTGTSAPSLSGKHSSIRNGTWAVDRSRFVRLSSIILLTPESHDGEDLFCDIFRTFLTGYYIATLAGRGGGRLRLACLIRFHSVASDFLRGRARRRCSINEPRTYSIERSTHIHRQRPQKTYYPETRDERGP